MPSSASWPPVSRPLSTCGRSSTPQGGNDSPSCGTLRPQALATAAISSADLVPSRKELNICGFMPAALRLLRGQAVVLPDAVGGHGVIGGQVLGALAGGDDLEAAGARPVDLLGDQRRLVAIGHRIDDAPLARLPGEQRPGQHVGLDIDHDDRRAGLDRGERMGDAGGRIAGRLDHDVDGARIARVLAVGDEARARRCGPRPSRRCGRRCGPARGRGRRSPRPRAREWSAPARGTSSRTCRRRSGRRGPACRSAGGRRGDG